MLLREAKTSEDARPASVAHLAVPASQVLSPSLHGALLIPSTDDASSTCLAPACASNHLESVESGQMQLNDAM